MTIYTDNGYKDRADYLQHQAEDYGIPLDTVYAVADLLGPLGDFDGLITALEDAESAGIL